MAYKCEICGKKPIAGFSYSHSHRASKRLFKPNLQKQKVQLNGLVQSVYLCTTCIKSGKSVRPLIKQKKPVVSGGKQPAK